MSHDEEILVISRKNLFSDDYFNGFVCLSDSTKKYFERIRNLPEFKPRNEVEEDPHYKQPIPYVVFVKTENNKMYVLAYRRSAGSDYVEERLKGKWSIGVGGHIRKQEKENATVSNLIASALEREIKEELEINFKPEPKLIGFINYDSDELGQVHFGLVYIVQVPGQAEIKPKKEIAETVWKSIDELVKLNEKSEKDKSIIIETWSKVLIGYLFQLYLQKMN